MKRVQDPEGRDMDQDLAMVDTILLLEARHNTGHRWFTREMFYHVDDVFRSWQRGPHNRDTTMRLTDVFGRTFEFKNQLGTCINANDPQSEEFAEIDSRFMLVCVPICGNPYPGSLPSGLARAHSD